MSPRALLPADQAQTLELAAAVRTSDAGIVSRTVLQTPELRVVLFAFAEGRELAGHSSRRRAVVQVLQGEREFLFNGTGSRLAAGALLHLPPGRPHAVRAALGAFSMLLTPGPEQAYPNFHHTLPVMNTETTSAQTIDLAQLDVRPIPCRQKHALIFQRWALLGVGEHFVLVNDHDPVPLYYQFAGQFPGAFDWEYLVAGPDEFQVKITRLAATVQPVRLAPPRAPGTPPVGDAGLSVSSSSPAADAPAEVDARGLEPPGPMPRILAALEQTAPGVVLRVRTDRRPVHLLPELDARGVTHVSEEQADGTWITTLLHA